jgi:hypothetical protein
MTGGASIAGSAEFFISQFLRTAAMSRSGTFSEQDLHFSGICGSVSTEFERFARANLFFM